MLKKLFDRIFQFSHKDNINLVKEAIKHNIMGATVGLIVKAKLELEKERTKASNVKHYENLKKEL